MLFFVLSFIRTDLKHSNSFLMDGIKFEAVYMPTGFGIIKSYELVSGTCPEQYNEIVIDKNVQLELGYQLNIGDTITLPTAESKTEDFIITGFTDNVETGTYYFYVSRHMQNGACYYLIFRIVL